MRAICQVLLFVGLLNSACERKVRPELENCAGPNAHASEGITLSAKSIPTEIADYNPLSGENSFDAATPKPQTEEDVKQAELDRIRSRAGSAAPALEVEAEAHEVEAITQDKFPHPFPEAKRALSMGRLEEAKNNYLNACQKGKAEACHKFAWHEEQQGNAANARQFYRLACNGGLGKACNNLGFQFERLKNYDSALDLYAKACMNKHEVSCQNLKRLQAQQLKAR